MSKLSTIVSYPDRNNSYGNNKYRGNCSGELIKDLLTHFNPKHAYDPMVGGGTFRDVCIDLGVEHFCTDLNPQFGGWNALEDEVPESSDFIFWHPPYHDIIQYSGNMWGNADPRDLSRCETYEDFISKINKVEAKLLASLRKGGRMAILVGDVKRKGVLYSMQKDMAWFGQPEQVIIKAQHNCFSDNTHYSGNFIPIVHEYVLIFKRDDCYLVPTKIVKQVNVDLKQRPNQTWRDVVLAALEKLGGRSSLDKLYNEIEGHAKTKTNPHWNEKVRQVLQEKTNDFINVARGEYALKPFGKVNTSMATA
jgi:hypothetical protein